MVVVGDLLEERAGVAAYNPIEVGHVPSSWDPVDLGPILRGEAPDEVPTMWRRTDGVALLYPGKIHAINAESESGKTWMALSVCAEVMLEGEQVFFIDFEDSPASVVGRLVDLGVPADVVEICFHYIRPDDPLTPELSEALVASVMAVGASLAVVDGVTEAMVLHGFSIKDNDDAARFIALLLRPLQRTGATVLVLDHVTKSKEDRGRFAIGAQHKLAGIDGAVYTAKVIDPYGRGRTGTSRLEVAKDRPGHVRAVAGDGKRIGTFRLVSEGDRLRAEVVADDGGTESGLSDALLARVSQALAEHGPLSQSKLVERVSGNAHMVRIAASFLVDLECATEHEGPRKARIFTHVKPYESAAK